MNHFHDRNTSQPKHVKLVHFAENYGNSVALYTLLIIVAVGIWLLSPIPSPNWTVNGYVVGWASVVFISMTTLHGLLWFIITRDFLPLSSKMKRFLANSIKVVKPLHMMTGMIGLGLAFMHGIAFMSPVEYGSPLFLTGLIAMVALFVLAIDGIGLMVTPLLSRKVHRWIAVIFLIALIVHLV